VAKGMIFNMDVMIAVFVMTIFIATIVLVEQPKPENINLERISYDINTVLDKGNVLQTLNSSIISSSTKQLLSQNMDSAINISCFIYNNSYNASDPNSPMFIPDVNLTIQPVKNSTKSQPVVVSPRYFPLLGNSSVSRYCMSRLEVWYI